MIDLLIQEISNYDYDKYFKDWQSGLMIARQVQLLIGCCILFFIVANIFYKRLYVYNTTKLFMFFSFCYFVGMFVVLIHRQALTSDEKYYYDQLANLTPEMSEHYIINVLSKMQKDGNMIWCALEGFINFFFYNLGYLFAVLITYYVSCVINENYHNFMRNVFKMKKVQLLLLAIFGLYLVPFILAIVQTNIQESYAYSYGPAGFKIETSQGPQSANLIFYCGMCYNPTSQLFNFLEIANIYISPLFLFVIHSFILLSNRKKINKITNSLDQLTSKQLFIIKTGKISIVVFIIQGLSFLKSFLTLIPIFSSFYTFFIILNYAYDFYPFIILYFYLRYTKEKRGLLHGSSTILTEE